MTERCHEMITARRNLAKKMLSENKTEDDIYNACRALKYEQYVTEIRNAETAIESYAKYYHAKESECPDSFKFLMLLNDWHSPFIALNELLKVIDKNQMLIKRKEKKTGVKSLYRSRYAELRALLQKEVNKNGKTPSARAT